MCIVLLSLCYHKGYKLVMLVNRDEYFVRPTSDFSFWKKPNESILGAQDLEKNGTQFGISKSKRFAVLTNYRKPGSNKTSSRGQLVVDFLRGEQSPLEYLKHLKTIGDQYEAFNIIVGDIQSGEICYLTNHGSEGPLVLQPGKVYGLSNEVLDSTWPKIERGKFLLSELNTVDVETLFHILNDVHPVPDEKVQKTGYGFDLERNMTSIFVKPFTWLNDKQFGTRQQVVVIVDDQDKVQVFNRCIEKNWEINCFEL
eukprot:TRINITY_DN1691_c0_g1_i1.p1 TRINITY_DN1691_c0_g1~~TRINITY_DN1691_c0_g1_i1.p1  ORF type:complete len:255 (-),score=10.21 TRINITY_DN1691_c0_g1_i1:10-774(-)